MIRPRTRFLARIPNFRIYDLADGAGWPMVKASMGNAMRSYGLWS